MLWVGCNDSVVDLLFLIVRSMVDLVDERWVLRGLDETKKKKAREKRIQRTSEIFNHSPLLKKGWEREHSNVGRV